MNKQLEPSRKCLSFVMPYFKMPLFSLCPKPPNKSLPPPQKKTTSSLPPKRNQISLNVQIILISCIFWWINNVIHFNYIINYNHYSRIGQISLLTIFSDQDWTKQEANIGKLAFFLLSLFYFINRYKKYLSLRIKI